MPIENVVSADVLRQLQDQKLALDASAIVAQTDHRGVITMVNDKFCSISGFSREELIGKDHRIVNSGVHPKAFFDEMWRTISRGEIWRGEICNRKKNGQLYWVQTTITPFLDQAGKPYQYMAIRQDITEIKNAERIIVEQQSQLISASRLSAIGEMAAAITHEINNPLAVILGRTEMIQALAESGSVDPQNLLRLTQTIAATAKRIEKIVRSMKTLAYHGKEDEPFVTCSLNEILVDALELCTQRFRNHGVQLTVPDLKEPLQIDCRSHQIVQVLVNLLNNAHDAVQGLERKWVKLEITRGPAELCFAITDSGPGIPEDVQIKLFTPFFSTKRLQYGTGLGLSISRSIVENHRGSLTYDASSANTRFLLRLPVAQLTVQRTLLEAPLQVGWD